VSRKLDNKGFGVVAIAITLVVLAAIAFSGWKVYKHNHKKTTADNKSHNTSSNNKASSSTESADSDSANKTTSTQPILGQPWTPSQQGYGTIEPTEINNGGDSTGIVTNITWQAWGSTQAIGRGVSTYLNPSSTVSEGTQASATVVAFNLGTCSGKPAYTAVEWYFPQYGQLFNPSHYRNICTGQEIGE